MQKNFDYIKFAHIPPTSQNFHLRFVLLKIDFLNCMDIIEPVYIKKLPSSQSYLFKAVFLYQLLYTATAIFLSGKN